MLCRLAAAVLAVGAALPAQNWEDLATRTPVARGDTVVVGFLGGRERWNNEQRSPRKLALKLRSLAIPGMHVESFANQKRGLAAQFVQRAFQGAGESARVVVYGLSFGGAAVVKLANDLRDLGIPVLLTVQVDSVGLGDGIIPANVHKAANFYQKDGIFISGEGPIRAANPKRTTIAVDCRVRWENREIDVSQIGWFKKLGRTAHTRISYDPEVWERVERLIVAAVQGQDVDVGCPSP